MMSQCKFKKKHKKMNWCICSLFGWRVA